MRKQDDSGYENDNRDEDEEQRPRLVGADFVVEDEGVEETMGRYLSDISSLLERNAYPVAVYTP